MTDARDVIVIGSGLATTALAFGGVAWADHAGTHLMGQYSFLWGMLPLPVGALGVGVAASLGYGIASFITERKVSGRLLLVVMALLAGSYFAAQYIEYRLLTADLGKRAVDFWTYFDHMTRSFAWQEQSFGESGPAQPLGALGYGLRLLEVAGFVGGGVIVPAALRKKPYCDRCRCYRQSKWLAMIPIGDDEAEAHRRLRAIASAAGPAR